MPSLRSKQSAVADDLSTRILAAEQAVIRRDARIREQLDLVGAHARRLASPERWLTTVGGGIAALLLGRLLGGRASSDKRRARADQGGGAWSLALRLLLPLVSSWLARDRGRRQ
jgi:hypothetical protein